MPATEIPPKRPLPPAPPQIEGSDLYDAQRWEKVYREMHTAPELLVQLQDDLSLARKREAFWISVICHLALAILVGIHKVSLDTFRRAGSLLRTRAMRKSSPIWNYRRTSRWLRRSPKTNKISDKDRVATKQHTKS